MKDLLQKITRRDKSITAACSTPDGIEWTALKTRQDGTESIHQGDFPLVLPAEDAVEIEADAFTLPENTPEILKGDLTIALPSSELLMRTITLPTADPAEIAEMVEFQVEKMAPFPMDKLAMSHEVLRTDENSSLVLIATARRESIDALGDSFLKAGLRIHSIDARVLGWLQLMPQDEQAEDETSCSIVIIQDRVDFVLVVLKNSIPLAFRPMKSQITDEHFIDELLQEIKYTFTVLDAEYELPAPAEIHFWTYEELPDQLSSELKEKGGIAVENHNLDELPPLSEGILRRTQSAGSRIEFIPREWIELQERRQLQRQFITASAAIGAVWLLVILIFFGIYKTRDFKLASVKKDLEAISPAANKALENREKLQALKLYTNRSDSSLECLREVTQLLPAGDIEFVSYSYTKGKGVTLRGTAQNNDIAYNFFSKLAESGLFAQLKDQSVTTRTTKGERRTVFSVTLTLPSAEDKQ